MGAAERVGGGGREVGEFARVSGWGWQGHGLNGSEVEGTSVSCSSVLAGQP